MMSATAYMQVCGRACGDEQRSVWKARSSTVSLSAAHLGCCNVPKLRLLSLLSFGVCIQHCHWELHLSRGLVAVMIWLPKPDSQQCTTSAPALHLQQKEICPSESKNRAVYYRLQKRSKSQVAVVPSFSRTMPGTMMQHTMRGAPAVDAAGRKVGGLTAIHSQGGDPSLWQTLVLTSDCRTGCASAGSCAPSSSIHEAPEDQQVCLAIQNQGRRRCDWEDVRNAALPVGDGHKQRWLHTFSRLFPRRLAGVPLPLCMPSWRTHRSVPPSQRR
jgi:hypothetical protein